MLLALLIFSVVIGVLIALFSLFSAGMEGASLLAGILAVGLVLALIFFGGDIVTFLSDEIVGTTSVGPSDGGQ